MNVSFTYSLTLDDYIGFEKIMIKQKYFGIMTYISTLILLAVGAFSYVGTKEPSLLILSVAYAAASILSVFAEKKLIPQRKAKKYTRLDNTYFAPRKVIISDSAVELSLESDGENPVESIGVYPIQSFAAVLESKDYIMLLAAVDSYIIPKSAIPIEQLATVENIFRARPNYLKAK